MEIKDYINDVSFIKPVYNRSKCIPVVLVCDCRNIPETMVTILSISELKDDFYYDVIIIHNTLDEYDIAAFMHMSENIAASKMELRFEKIEHDFTKGYIHIDLNYKKEYVLKCFLPIILKRYTKFIYVRSGNVMTAGIPQFYEVFTEEQKFRTISTGDLVEAVVYDSAKFRMRYSAEDIKNSMTKGTSELDIDFLRKLSGAISCELPDGIIETYNNEHPSVSFRKLISRVPYFEKWIYEWSKQDNRRNTAGTTKKIPDTEFYLFPFESVSRDARVVLYGNGKVGGQFRQQIEMTHFCKLIAVADKNEAKGIMRPSEVGNLEFDHVVIAVANDDAASEIRHDLIMYGVIADKIIYAGGRKL